MAHYQGSVSFPAMVRSGHLGFCGFTTRFRAMVLLRPIDLV
jgi:hypothetical protein